MLSSDSLISETMYGLQRTSLTEDNMIMPLNIQQKAIVFLTEVITPYLIDYSITSLHINSVRGINQLQNREFTLII